MRGVGTYPKEWDAIATDVKARAGWRCIRCGHPYVLTFESEHDAEEAMWRIFPASNQGGALKAGWIRPIPGGGYMIRSGILPCDEGCDDHRDGPVKRRVLTVHHFDGDKENCAWWNLGALCQVCHLQVQGRVRMDQAYMHPHTLWFRLYVAGYYASMVLGEDLMRDEVERRLCELLTAGQPQLAEFYIDNT